MSNFVFPKDLILFQ